MLGLKFKGGYNTSKVELTIVVTFGDYFQRSREYSVATVLEDSCIKWRNLNFHNSEEARAWMESLHGAKD